MSTWQEAHLSSKQSLFCCPLPQVCVLYLPLTIVFFSWVLSDVSQECQGSVLGEGIGCRGGCLRQGLWAGVRTGWKSILWVREWEKVLGVFLQFFSLLSLFQPAVVASNSALERHRHFIISGNWIITWGNNWCPLFCNQLTRFKGAGDGTNRRWDSRQSTSVPWPLRRQQKETWFVPACLFPLVAAAFANALSHTHTYWAAGGASGRRVCHTGVSARVCVCEQVCYDQTWESAFLAVLQSAKSWRRLCIFHWDKTHGFSPLPQLILTWFPAHTVKVMLIHGEIRAPVSAATGMCLCQLLPCFFRYSQALPGFQMAAGFQDWHLQLHVHL